MSLITELKFKLCGFFYFSFFVKRLMAVKKILMPGGKKPQFATPHGNLITPAQCEILNTDDTNTFFRTITSAPAQNKVFDPFSREFKQK